MNILSSYHTSPSGMNRQHAAHTTAVSIYTSVPANAPKAVLLQQYNLLFRSCVRATTSVLPVLYRILPHPAWKLKGSDFHGFWKRRRPLVKRASIPTCPSLLSITTRNRHETDERVQADVATIPPLARTVVTTLAGTVPCTQTCGGSYSVNHTPRSTYRVYGFNCYSIIRVQKQYL